MAATYCKGIKSKNIHSKTIIVPSFEDIEKREPPESLTPEGFVTVGDVAKQYRMSHRYVSSKLYDYTLRGLIDRKEIGQGKGKRCFYKEEDVERCFGLKNRERVAPPLEWFCVSQLSILFNISKSTLQSRICRAEKNNKRFKRKRFTCPDTGYVSVFFDINEIRSIISSS